MYVLRKYTGRSIVQSTASQQKDDMHARVLPLACDRSVTRLAKYVMPSTATLLLSAQVPKEEDNAD